MVFLFMKLFKDENGIAVQLAPSGVALATTLDTTVSTTTEITLNAATHFLRCYATTQDVYLKWGTADVTSSNFDEILPAGQVVDLVVPFSSGTTRYTAINLLERAASAAVIIIEK